MKVEEAEKNQSDNFTNIDFTTPTKKYNSSINIDFKADNISRNYCNIGVANLPSEVIEVI